LHQSYFAVFYCYEILSKLRPGTIIHIHDCQQPDVLLEGYKRGWWTTGEFCPYPSVTDEYYTVAMFLKHNLSKFKILCNTSDLVENHLNELDFIPGSADDQYKSMLVKNGNNASASALWLIKY
jgi:hypothetical protein